MYHDRIVWGMGCIIVLDSRLEKWSQKSRKKYPRKRALTIYLILDCGKVASDFDNRLEKVASGFYIGFFSPEREYRRVKLLGIIEVFPSPPSDYRFIF